MDPVNVVLHHPKLVPAVVAAIAAVAAVWLATSVSRWRRISWRDHLDASISLVPRAARGDGGWAAWKIFTHREEVAQPSLVLLRIRNAGFRSIGPADIKRPLTFTFPGREVKEFAVTDCRGVTREMIQPPGTPASPAAGNRIALPRFPMRRRASFKLLVLLSGTDRGVLGKGYLRRGRVIREARGRGPLARNLAFGTLLALLLGTQAGITFGQRPAIPAWCATGRLAVEGSTAFAPVAQQISEAYAATCHGAAISVSAIATFNGLNAVAGAGGRQRPGTAAQIAMSDGPKPAGYPALTGHPVGVIVFAVVVSKQAGVFNLSTAQLRGIFLGSITNWRQVGGADLPVRIVARATGSGTRRAFDQKVLGGQGEPGFSSYNCVDKNAVHAATFIRCEVADTATLLQRVNTIPGAIGYAQISDAAAYANVERMKIGGWDPDIGAVERGVYPFWTVEYLYTYGEPARGTLAASFLDYFRSDTAKDILRSQAYTPCVDRQQSLAGTLCRG